MNVLTNNVIDAIRQCKDICSEPEYLAKNEAYKFIATVNGVQHTLYVKEQYDACDLQNMQRVEFRTLLTDGFVGVLKITISENEFYTSKDKPELIRQVIYSLCKELFDD